MVSSPKACPRPFLASVPDPAALRALPGKSLPDLAVSIRRTLVETVCATGGHLGPNLGVVELTIAVHRVFHSPRDTVIFDIGHQGYVHKLLTGRWEAFGTLRQEGGLSGYLSPRPPIADQHTYSVALRLTRRFPPFGSLKSDIEITLYGLGLFRVTLCVPRVGLQLTAMFAPRPVDTWRVHLAVGVSVLLEPRGRSSRRAQPLIDAFSTAITPLNLRMIMADAYRDIPVWNGKRYAAPPRLAKGDGPLGAFRHWARQFYPADTSTADSVEPGSPRVTGSAEP